jgi:hypothetical protein
VFSFRKTMGETPMLQFFKGSLSDFTARCTEQEPSNFRRDWAAFVRIAGFIFQPPDRLFILTSTKLNNRGEIQMAASCNKQFYSNNSHFPVEAALPEL